MTVCVREKDCNADTFEPLDLENTVLVCAGTSSESAAKVRRPISRSSDQGQG